MKRITGLVLVKETGLGVANLVVAVFDSQPSPDSPRNQPPPLPLQQRAGRRLGSVLTDTEGAFNLTTEDLEFAGNEPRPDLILMVLAPEDVQDLKHPFPLPTEQRILYISAMPRVDAGAEEAYVIRLLKSQVDTFQIPTGPSGRDVNTAIADIADPVLRALDMRDGVKARLEPRLLAEQRRIAAARQIARTKVQSLSALPLHVKDPNDQKNALIIRGKTRLQQDLPALQAQAIKDGFARIKNIPMKPMRIRLTLAQLDSLNLNIKRGNRVSGKVLDKDLAKLAPSFSNVLDLVRVRQVEPPSALALAEKYLVDKPAVAAKKTSKPAAKKRVRKSKGRS